MDDALTQANALLRPTKDAALTAWAALVRAEREQVERLPNRPRPQDFYGPIAEAFRADPRRSGDALVDHLRTLVRPDETWVDVGAGGGRYALPIALLAKQVYAVEPSEGMRGVLSAALATEGIANVQIFAERWAGPSQVPVADVGFISHVGYDIEDIGPFLDQLEAHARRRCIAVMYEKAPISDFGPLWEPVHGQPRALLPGMREFIALAYARGRSPEIHLIPGSPRRFESLPELHEAARRPLWVLPDTPEDLRLADAVRTLALPHEGGFVLTKLGRPLGIVSWATTPLEL